MSLAAVATSLTVLCMGLWLLTVAFFSSHDLTPRGVQVIGPSVIEVTIGILRHVGLPLVAVALLALTWRNGLRGRSGRSWVLATATAGVAVVSVLL